MDFESNTQKNIFFREIYQKYSTKVRGALYRQVAPRDVDDLVQEVFVKIWKSLEHLKDPQKINSWIYRICYHQSVDYYRRKKDPPANLDPELIDSEDPVDLEKKQQVLKALQQLKLDHRILANLYFFEELELSEIAEIMNIPLGTVKSRVFYIKKTMLEFLSREEKDEEFKN